MSVNGHKIELKKTYTRILIKKNYINTIQFLKQTDRFVSEDINESQSQAAGFNLVLFLCFFVSQSRGSHWLPLYDWETATVSKS